MTRDQLFNRLANFLKQNAQLVADARDSNRPWTLLANLQSVFAEEQVSQQRTHRKKKRRGR